MHVERRPDRSPEVLETRLRALPPPALPVDLKARLLARIPMRRPILWRRAAVVGALAAACLLAVVAWPKRDDSQRLTGRPDSAPSRQANARPKDDGGRVAVRAEIPGVREGPQLPPFTWPLQGTSPLREATAIPADLLD